MTTPHEHKPEWCPSDIWSASLDVCDDPVIQVAAARAILDERHRCEVARSARLPYNLTKRMRDLALFIHDYGSRNGVAPSYEEMAYALGVRSKSGVHRLVAALVDRGVIETKPYKARILTIADRYLAPPNGQGD